MPRKYLIVLSFMAVVGARHAVPLDGLAFADTRTQDGQPCPPECVTDSMEIVTWYPSPYNEYEELRLYPIAQSNSQCNQDSEGLMYYNNDKNQVLLCKEIGTFTYGWTPVGGGTSGNYSTADRPVCDAYSLGIIIFDTDKNKPYVCVSGGVYKPLDSDYDEDGITDVVDANDNDFNDATAVEANVETGKTFYARGGSRRTGTASINPSLPMGWSGLCVWQAGDVSCPAKYSAKHIRTVCSSYGVTGGGAQFIQQNSWITHSCAGQDCTIFLATPTPSWGSIHNVPGTGTCNSQSIYTYCCE